jgi:predicted nucleic-acid-binding Zn-ribbon protein
MAAHEPEGGVMARIEANCSQCGGVEFEDGFIEDNGQGSQGYARWIAGPLERGIFGGAFRFGAQRWVIDAIRCTACNHLELYAAEET